MVSKVTPVTPVAPRRSSRITNPPQRLREDTPEKDRPQTKTKKRTTLPSVADILRDVTAECDLSTETPRPKDIPESPPEVDLSDSGSQSSAPSSSSEECHRHRSDNYTKKVCDMTNVFHHFCFVPDTSFVVKELYYRWRDVAESLAVAREDLSREQRDLKTCQKEVTYLERKVHTLDATEKKLTQSGSTIHELKVEKKQVADQLKRAIGDIKEVELSKRSLKESMVTKGKLEVERIKLIHATEVSKLSLEHEKSVLVIQARDDKIKSLQSEIDSLKSKAKQYDNIASSGIKSLISLNAFNERGYAR